MTRRLTAALAVAALTLAACGSGSSSESAPPPAPSSTAVPESPATSETPDGDSNGDSNGTDGHYQQGKPAKPEPLRPGEKRTTLKMAEPYTPSAPYGVGNDDYRCFLLDPELDEDAWLTGTNVRPGNPDVVHHVILFRVAPESVPAAESKDAEDTAPGWTCFGGSGVAGEFDNPDDASWLGAWAPGGKETVLREGYGVQLDRGSRVVMQVHYNLLAGDAPDTSATEVRWTPRASSDLTALHTMLLPAPVELPCRPGRDASPLCDREAAVQDAKARFGEVGNMANLLHLLCGSDIEATNTTTCTREVRRPLTVLGSAGHMHLLGRWIKIEVNAGTPDARTVLDIAEWDFDNQGSRPVQPVRLDVGDTVTVTCQHEQDLRDQLPAFAGEEEKYVVWAEGTKDEMCLGMLQVAFDGDAVS